MNEMTSRNMSQKMSQNLTFWNLDFYVSPGALFQEPCIHYVVLDNEHKSAQQLFEHK
jgi:hypothetical protein